MVEHLDAVRRTTYEVLSKLDKQILAVEGIPLAKLLPAKLTGKNATCRTGHSAGLVAYLGESYHHRGEPVQC